MTQEFLIAAFIGLVAVPLINYAKDALGWYGGKALVLTVAVSAVGGLAVYGIGTLVGLYEFPGISWDTLPALVATVFAIGQLVYRSIAIARE